MWNNLGGIAIARREAIKVYSGEREHGHQFENNEGGEGE